MSSFNAPVLISPEANSLARALHGPGAILDAPDTDYINAAFDTYIARLYGVEPGTVEAESIVAASLISDAYESGLNTNEAELLVQAEELGVLALSSLNLKRIDVRIRRQRSGTMSQLTDLQPANVILAAADLISAPAYKDKFRKNGHRPYYYHPLEAGAIGFSVMEGLRQAGEIDNDFAFEDAVLGLVLEHDGAEETVRSCKYFSPRRPQSFTPLLVQRVLEDLRNPYGADAAKALFLMTHHQKQPWTSDYREYVRRGLRAPEGTEFADTIPHLMFCIVKFLDMYHNRVIEPKPARATDSAATRLKIARKNIDYDWGLEIIPGIAVENAADSQASEWLPEFFARVQQFKAEDVPAAVRKFGQHIYGDEKPEHWQLAA